MLVKFKKFSSWFWASIFLISLISGSAWAQAVAGHGSGGGATLGTVASGLTEATDVFTGIFKAMFYVIGIAMVAASIMRYRDYRQNPVQTPIGRVIFLLLAGLIVGFFPWIVNHINAVMAHT